MSIRAYEELRNTDAAMQVRLAALEARVAELEQAVTAPRTPDVGTATPRIVLGARKVS